MVGSMVKLGLGWRRMEEALKCRCDRRKGCGKDMGCGGARCEEGQGCTEVGSKGCDVGRGSSGARSKGSDGAGSRKCHEDWRRSGHGAVVVLGEG